MKTFPTSEILDRLRNALNQSNDTELANFLGVKKATLSNWRSRNSLDWPLLFSFCEHIDLNWIIFGDSKAIPPTNQESLAINTNSSLVEHLDNKLKEKDKEIGSLNKEIGKLEARIEQLEKEHRDNQVFSTTNIPKVETPSPPVLQDR